jgi:topoisomerase-4 subunit A
VGLGLKKDEYICDCSDIDDIIVFCEDGKFKVIKVADKTFVGKDIIHAAVFKKNDDRAVYHMIYKDGSTGKSYVKRFSVGGVTRDKDYDLTQGSKGSSVLYFTANPNGESEVVTVNLKPMSKIRKLSIDIDFAELAVKGRNSMGNVVTKFPVKKVVQKSKGVSTLGGRAIWFDDIVRRLNTDGRGRYLGTFQGEDKILVIYQDGTYELTNFDLTNHFDDKYFVLEKFDAERVVNAIHLDGSNKSSFVKRFVVENTSINKKFSFVSEAPGSKCWFASTAIEPMVRVCFTKDGKTQPGDLELNIAAFIEVKGMKAIGNKMSKYNVKEVVDISEKHNIDEVDEEDLEALQKAVDDIKAKKNPSAEPSKPKSNIEFTITNPDDIDMDGEGQTKLF